MLHRRQLEWRIGNSRHGRSRGIGSYHLFRSSRSFAEQLAKLPENTLIYPGHDYIENNLRFTLSREPDNKRAQDMLDRLKGQDPGNAYVTTLAVEREINTFFRLSSPSVIAKLREAFSDLPENPDERTVFLKLRELRNKW